MYLFIVYFDIYSFFIKIKFIWDECKQMLIFWHPQPKITVYIWEYDVKFLFKKLNFTQFVNCHVKILDRKLYWPSLSDVAWLEGAHLIFLIFIHSKFGWVVGIHRKNYKINWASSSRAMSFKFGEYNLLPNLAG